MDRITNVDLDNMLARYLQALERLGLAPTGEERVGMTHGSKTYGIAYRIYSTGGELGTGHGRPPVGDDFLGMTKREAFDALADRCRVMEDVAYALNL